MHRCLQVQEILELIFRELEELERWSKFRALPGLARTCKAFHTPAIRVIWQKIPTLLVICGLEPKAFRVNGNGTTSIVKEDLLSQPRFIQRLQHYTPHVKRIGTILHDSAKDFDYSALHWLYANPAMPRPLFPNAVDVTLPCFSRYPFEAVFYPALVLGPSVRMVMILANGINWDGGRIAEDLDNPRWKAISGRLQPFAHNINCFSICSNARGGVCLPSIDSLLRHCTTSLTSLTIRNIVLEPDSLRVLSQLGHIEALEVAVDENLDPTYFSNGLPFPKLTFLSLVALSIDGLIDFLRNIRTPALEAFEFEVHGSLSWRYIELEDIFSALVSDCTPPKLSSINALVLEGNSGCFPIRDTTFYPLLACRNMETVCIDKCIQPDIKDAALADVFSAWPNLSEFSLRPFEDDDDIYWGPLTLAGVHTALKHCPNLDILTLPCDTRRLPSLDNDPNSTSLTPHRSLRSWALWNSAIASGEQVGRFLHKFYPALLADDIFTFPFFRSKLRQGRLDVAPHDDDVEAAAMVDQWTDVVHTLNDLRGCDVRI
ncbi:hypothetical protein CC2G_008544 [Coprinopsis cinerea AmutBmut pab1-1]|nr:hypothetical protein CC2G_008544 [Coprinopsis cinerea AmutBmut pab1-1]